MKEVVLALMQRGDRWFLQRRDLANPVFPGLWEFPGGKVEEGETPEQALRRELWEEAHVRLRAVRPGPAIDGLPRLNPFFVHWDGEPDTDLAWGWFSVTEMLRLPMPPRNHALIAGWDKDPSTPELRGGPTHLIG